MTPMCSLTVQFDRLNRQRGKSVKRGYGQFVAKPICRANFTRNVCFGGAKPRILDRTKSLTRFAPLLLCSLFPYSGIGFVLFGLAYNLLLSCRLTFGSLYLISLTARGFIILTCVWYAHMVPKVPCVRTILRSSMVHLYMCVFYEVEYTHTHRVPKVPCVCVCILLRRIHTCTMYHTTT